MQNSQFDRLIKLAQKTGDRLIVTDPSGSEPMVILPLSEYEGLLDYGSFRKDGKTRDLEKRSHTHVREPAFESRREVEEEIPGEVEFDPEALEEQVRAAMVVEEPEFVPVETRPSSPVVPPLSSEEGPVDLVEEASALVPEPPRKPIARRGRREEGEEQFYMEPV